MYPILKRLAGLLIFLVLTLPLQARELRLLSYNIRYDNPADAPHHWQARLPLIRKQLESFDADVVGFQEVLHHQLDDLSQVLPGYAWVGVGRDDGLQAGEYAPLFFRPLRFALKDSGSFWLSDTPDQVSRGWDAALPRIATWAVLSDRHTLTDFLVVNTHFDHMGQQARLNSMALIYAFLIQHQDKQIILMGDLNTPPEDAPYQWLMQKGLLQDTFAAAAHRKGPAGTFNAFAYTDIGQRIDYIFVPRSLKVKKYEVLMESFNGILPSDHWPVMVVLDLPQ